MAKKKNRGRTAPRRTDAVARRQAPRRSDAAAPSWFTGWRRVGVFVVAMAAVAGAVWIVAGNDDDPEPSAAEEPMAAACRRLAGSPRERLTACLDELDAATLSPDATAELDAVVDGRSGKVLVAGDAVEADVDQVLLSDATDLHDVLLGDDEAAAAEALRADGIEAFVIDLDLARALDRDDAVVSRLAYHEFLEWFELHWVTTDGLVYGVRSEPMGVDDEVGQSLLAGLRARLEDGDAVPPQEWQPEAVRIIASMRLPGQTLAMRHSVGQEIETVLDDLADKLRRRWQREVEPLGLGRLEDRLDDVRLEVHVVTERADVELRHEGELADLWEMGIDGATLTEPLDDGSERFGYMPGSEATPRAILDPESFFELVAREFGWPDAGAWEDEDVRLTLIRDDHFMERMPGGGEAVRMMRGNPVVDMEEITDESIRDMLVAGGDWWLANQHPDGSFVYKYWPEDNRISTDYNEIRHLLGPRDLIDTWRYRRDPAYLDGARRAMDWLLPYEITPDDAPHPSLPHPDEGQVLYRYPLEARNGEPPNQKLGTVAVGLMAWVKWAEATGSHDEDDRIRAMAEYTLSQAEDDGRFDPYNVPPDHSYADAVNDIVPGEAALALGMVADYFDDTEWVEFFPKFLDHYEPWFRERAEKTRPHGRWPRERYDNQTRLELVQFGPWAVMASRQYYELTGDERSARFGLEIADWLIDNYQWDSERSPWPDYVGGYYKIPSELPAMQAFVYGEATAAAYRIALQFEPERKDKYDRATRETLRFLGVMQYDEVDSYFGPRPEFLLGGVRYAMNHGKVRTDYVGHALSTISQYLDARAMDPDVQTPVTPLEVGPEGSRPRPPAAPGPSEAGGAGADRGEEGAE